VFGEDEICSRDFDGLEVWFVEHFLVTDTVDLDAFNLYATELLRSWCRVGIV
jgi:hypothetical protein